MKSLWCKTTMLALALLMVLSCFAFVACGDKTPPVDPVDPADPVDPVDPMDPQDPVDPVEPVGPLFAFVENGATQYRLVRSDFANDDIKDLTKDVRKAIETVSGVKPALKTDWEDQDNNANIKEILIGETNRAESKAAMEALSENEYSISVSGNKIVIVGDSDLMLGLAVEEFLKTYVGYISETEYTAAASLMIPENLNKIFKFDISGNVAIYVTDPTLGYLDNLTTALKDEVDQLTVYGANDATLEQVFNAGKNGLVVIAGINQMPVGAIDAIYEYLSMDGRILTLGAGPFLEDSLYEHEGKWLTRSEYFLSADPFGYNEQEIALDTNKANTASRVSRMANVMSTKTTYTIGEYGLPDTRTQMLVEIDDYTKYDLFSFDVKDAPNKTNSLCLYAKAADANTQNLVIQVIDREGAEWFVTIELTEDWQFYRIPADCFAWYGGIESKNATPSLKQAAQIQIGLSNDRDSATKPGDHSFCIADVSLCEYTLAKTGGADTRKLDDFDSRKIYPITNAATISAHKNQIFVEDRNYVLPEEVFSCLQVGESVGYDNARHRRFIPLIEVKDSRGLLSGYAAWISILSSKGGNNGALEGSMIGSFSVTSEDFYNDNGIAAVVDAVKAMTRDRFLIEGGSDEYTYMTGDDTEIIAGVAHATLRTNDSTGLETRVTLYQGDKVLAQYSSNDYLLVNRKHDIYSFDDTYSLSDGTPDHVVASLYQDGVEIDRIAHDIYYWAPKPVAERKFVYTEDGYFKRDGEIVNFYGVNFGPSYRMSDTGYTWLGRDQYDPTIISYDLARIKDIGFNAVAIWAGYQNIVEGNTIVDIMRQCEEYGLYIDFAISGCAYPLKDSFNPENAQTILSRVHINENDNVIAYDIAWEERIGTYEGKWWISQGPEAENSFVGRRGWDDEWNQWIIDQYGSIAHAEQLWGVKTQKTKAGYVYVSDAMLNDESGRYHKIVSAYYRFIDDIVAREMYDGVAQLKAAAPNQLYSFRTSMAGCGYPLWGMYKPSVFCFDYQSLAPVLDFVSPEGYTLDTNWQQAVQIPIANAYARYCLPDSPVVWKEFSAGLGFDLSGDPRYAIDPNFWAFNITESHEANMANHYEWVMKYIHQSYTSAVFCWWSCPGYRPDENGECCVWNCDGSDRALTKVLREYAPKFINQGERPEADILLTVERDNQVGSIYGIYDLVHEDVQKAIEQGKFVAFINNKQKDEGDILYAHEVYKEAVGGTAESGSYPLRYVNGMVKDFKVVEKNGKSVAVITVCNTKQSTWKADTVFVASTEESDVDIYQEIGQNVGYLEDVTIEVPIKGKGEVAIRFEVEGVPFGPVYRTTIE